MTDPIADMLARINNAMKAHKTEVSIPFSKLKLRLATIIAEEGYITSVREDVDGSKKPVLVVTLKYDGNAPVIRELKRVSTPGRRVYAAADRLPYVYDNLGVAIISTSQGLMTNKKARSQKLGGEVICRIF